MKTSFVALVISLAGAAFASPAAESRIYPYSIGDISLKHLIESNTWDMTWSLTSRDNFGAATGTTTCHTAWLVITFPLETLQRPNAKELTQANRDNGSSPVGPTSAEPCANAAYQYWFPTGVNNVESYEIVIEGPVGSASTKIETGYKYQCGPYTGTIHNIDKECKTINGGEFYLQQ
jgi:hypothetical protein